MRDYVVRISGTWQLTGWRLESTGKGVSPMIPNFRAGDKGF